MAVTRLGLLSVVTVNRMDAFASSSSGSLEAVHVNGEYRRDKRDPPVFLLPNSWVVTGQNHSIVKIWLQKFRSCNEAPYLM